MSSLQDQTIRVPRVQVQPVLSIPLSVPEEWPHRPLLPALLRSGQDGGHALPTCQAAVLSSSQRSRLRSLDRQTTGREELWGGRENWKQRSKHPVGIRKQWKWRGNGVQASRGVDQCRVLHQGDNRNMWGRKAQAGADQRERNETMQSQWPELSLLMGHGWRLQREWWEGTESVKGKAWSMSEVTFERTELERDPQGVQNIVNTTFTRNKSAVYSFPRRKHLHSSVARACGLFLCIVMFRAHLVSHWDFVLSWSLEWIANTDQP